jgi:hypothetical protein
MTRIYCDMDGVLCFFDKRACDKWGFKPDGSGWYDIEDHHWKMIEYDTDFWAHMEWQPGGRELWEAVKSMDPWILSAYNKEVMQSTIIGKLEWVRRELLIPDWKVKVCMREDKFHFARNLDGTRNVLIDDNQTNVREWARAGGVAVYHKNNTESTVNIINSIKEGKISLEHAAVWSEIGTLPA